MKTPIIMISFCILLLFCEDLKKDIDKSNIIKDLTHWLDRGNYCGPYNNKKFQYPIPVDNIDACCKIHDEDYRAIVKSGNKIHISLCQGDAQEEADNTLVECVETLPDIKEDWEFPPDNNTEAEIYIQGIRALFGWCE